jgi:hypothetical protein
VPLPYALVTLPWQDDDNGYGLTFDKQKDQDRAVAQAINAGVVFELSPGTGDVQDRNAKLLKQYIESRKALQRRAFKREPEADRKRRYALATLDGRRDDLARTTVNRDDATNAAIWYLAGLVNVGALTRDEVCDAIVASAYANGLDRDRRNGGIGKIQANVDRGLDKATHEFDWETVPWRTANAVDNANESDGSDDAAPVYASRLLSRSDLMALADPKPLIDNVLDQGTVALLYGKWGTAKTFIALDWAASVATGRNWQGRRTEQRRTLYVVGEGAFGFKGRTAAWETGWQTKIDDDTLSILPVPVNLTNATEVANLRALIEWGGYGFVILDTLARCMVGADENSAQDGGIVVDALTRLLASTPGGRGVVLGVHHTGKDGKTLRGSSAFESGADTVYCATRDENLISLIREKRKDGPENDSHLLVFEPMPGSDSGVMNASRGVSQGGETTHRAATLRSIMSQSFRLTGASVAQLRQIAVDDGALTRATFYRAVSDLVESGWLINTGSEKRPFYQVRVDDG